MSGQTAYVQKHIRSMQTMRRSRTQPLDQARYHPQPGHPIRIDVRQIAPFRLRFASYAIAAAGLGLLVIAPRAAARPLLISTPESAAIWLIPAAAAVLPLTAFALWQFQRRVRRRRIQQLEEAVALRTRELQRDKLRAEETSRLKSDFLTSIGHEIRTPVQGILGIAELMLKLELSAEQREYMEASRESADSLLALLNELQDFSKIEARRLELQNESFHLRHCVMSCLDTVRARAGAKQIGIDFRIDSEIPEMVFGDPVRLRQILLTLLDNAIKFTSAGSVGVLVSLDRTAGSSLPGTVDLRFEVFDSGIGIQPQQQQAIFDAFLHTDASPCSPHDGTGLGLAITKRLVQLMKGRIWVESEPGRGSRFLFTVPMGANPSPSYQDALPVPAGSGKGIRLRILLAEDNPVNQVVTARLLQTGGHIVMVANNGIEAVKAYKAGDFDLILMDVEMPELDGFQAAVQIRDFQARNALRTPILALTAHATDEYRRKCQEAGMDGYVSKPVTASELLAAVQATAALGDIAAE
jgi:signal transduction histidine kinase/ActR/RegA family two-component response regulator